MSARRVIAAGLRSEALARAQAQDANAIVQLDGPIVPKRIGSRRTQALTW